MDPALEIQKGVLEQSIAYTCEAKVLRIGLSRYGVASMETIATTFAGKPLPNPKLQRPPGLQGPILEAK